MHSLIKHTPLHSLEKYGRPDIYVKLECLQFSGSFKARGIVSLLRKVDTLSGLVAFTTGNHGVATAAIAKALNIPCIIVSSANITPYKKMLIESYGAKVEIVNFYSLEPSVEFAVNIAREKNYTFVTLYGNEHLLEGYSHIADELFKTFDFPFTTFLPVGTGSLILANSKRLKSLNPRNRVIANEPFVYQRLSSKFDSENRASPSIADSLSIDKIPDVNTDFLNYVDEVVPVTEEDIVAAMNFIHSNLGLVVEPGAAITLAAALNSEDGTKPKMVLITGGNISHEKFKEYTNQVNHGGNTH